MLSMRLGILGFSPNGSNIRVGNAPGALGTTLAAQSKAMVVNCHISMENDNVYIIYNYLRYIYIYIYIYVYSYFQI